MGLQLPFGILPTNPLPVDERYGPWASLAAAKAGVPLALRYNGLTVNITGSGEYWWTSDLTDTGLAVKADGGSAPVSITRTALQTLISGNSLVPGTIYNISDAQDALSGTVSVRAITVNTIDGNGSWTFDAKLGAQGRFTLATGAAGSVNQISIVTPSGSVDIMTSSVPFNTTRNQTATDVVANINANSGVSGFRAWTSLSTTNGANFDQPIIFIESLVGQTSFTYTMTVNVTTLTVSGQVNPVLGFNTANITLRSVYDLTNDRIISAYDGTNNISIHTTAAKIVSLGVNPVTKFRWNDIRFRSWNLIESLVQNVHFRTTAVQTINNLFLSSSTLEKCTLFTGSINDVTLTSGSIISSVNATTLSLNAIYGRVSVQNVDANNIVISNIKDTVFTLSNSTFGTSTTKATLTFSDIKGGTVLLNLNNYGITGTFNMQGLFIEGFSTLSITSNTWITSGGAIFRFNNNNLKANFTLNDVINQTRTIIVGNTFGNAVFLINIDFPAVAISDTIVITSNVLMGQSNNITNYPSLDIQGYVMNFEIGISNCPGGGIRLLSNVGSFGYIAFYQSYLDPAYVICPITGGSININESTVMETILGTEFSDPGAKTLIIDKSNVIGCSFNYMNNLTLTDVDFYNVSSGAPVLGINQNSLIVTSSKITDSSIFPDPIIVPDSVTLHMNGSEIVSSSILIGDDQDALTYVQITYSKIINSTINLGLATGVTPVVCSFNKSTLETSTLESRTTTGPHTYLNTTLINASITDNSGVNVPEIVTATNLTLKNVNFQWTVNAIADSNLFTFEDFYYDGGVKLPGSLKYFTVDSVTYSGIALFRYSRIENGTYNINHVWSPPDFPGVVSYIVTNILPGFAWKYSIVKAHGTVHSLNSNLSLGTFGIATEYFPSTSRITLESTAVESSGFLQPTTSNTEDLRVFSTVEALFKSGAYPLSVIDINVEGRMLSNYN